MNIDEIRLKVNTVIADQFQCRESDIRPDATLADLGLDSISAMELLMCLEEELDILLDDDAFTEDVTMAALYLLLEERQHATQLS